MRDLGSVNSAGYGV